MSFNPGDSTENPDINPGAHAGPVQEGMAPGVPIESGLVDSPAKSGSNDFALASGLLVDATPTDPAWNGWDVARIMIMFVVCFFVALLAMLAIVPGAGFKARAMRLAASPALAILAQMLAYVLLLGYMYILVTKERGRPRFWSAIHWNWPAKIGPFLLVGLAMQIVFVILENFLPFPKQTPFDELLQMRAALVMISVFAVTLGPLMEELFFRGFLYPVLARRFGMLTGVIATAVPFGLMHAAQYGYSWASVLLVSVVGVVLGTVRAKRDSVGAGFIVHVAYNGTIMVMLLIATGGFQHLERLKQ
jgi:hypothetical protein